ncbi:papain-like cysteine protease family protein [Ferruginibacter sp.]
MALPPCAADTCVSSGVKGNFYIVKQPTANCCWATVLAMMYSWKQQSFISEKEVLSPYPHYANLFSTGAANGIRVEEEIALYDSLGLAIERQQNPTIQGWCEMIDRYGPLSVTIDAHPPFGTMHAILILAVYGANTGLHTTIIYADPATGTIHTEGFLIFMKMYESKYSVDWPIQNHTF